MTAVEQQGLVLSQEHLAGRRLSREYQRQTQAAIMRFYRYLRARRVMDLRHLSPAMILDYQTWLLGQNRQDGKGPLSSSTVRGQMLAVQVLCTMLHRAHLTGVNAAADIPQVTVRQQARMVPSRSTMNEILEGMDTTTRMGLRNRALFELIYAAGLRAAEAAGVLLQDIDSSARTIRIRGKGNKERIVPLSEVALAFIQHYLDQRRVQNHHGPVFPNRKDPQRSISPHTVSRVFREEMEVRGMRDKGLVPHGIRHATATHLLENGAGIRYVGELLGHESLQTTVRYTKELYESIGAMYRRYHPRGLVGVGRFGSEYQLQVRHFLDSLERFD